MSFQTSPHFERLERLGFDAAQAADWLELPSPKPLLAALMQRDLPRWCEFCLRAMEAEGQRDPDALAIYTLGDLLAGDTWTATTARAAIPILVERAQNGLGSITYAELDAELRHRHPDRPPAGRMTKYAYPLGTIGSTIDKVRACARDAAAGVGPHYAHIPPLECLVVNGRTGLPGEGVDVFLANYLKGIGEPPRRNELIAHRRDVIERIHHDISNWPHWQLLLSLAQR